MNLVVGSTGALGSSVTRKLAAAGKPVTALVRNASSEKAKALQAAGARLVVGDLKERASLERALQGIGAVLCTASSTLSRGEGDSIETVDARGVQNLIEAAEAKGVRRFIYVSFSRNIAGDFPLAKAKRAAERRLESSGMDYTILLPSYFLETWLSPAVGFDAAKGAVRIYGDGRAKVSYVALEDVARAVVACLDNPAASRQAIPVGGPEPLSQLDLVRLVEEATAKKLQLEHMTVDQIQAARAGATDPLMASFLGLFEGLAKGDSLPGDWTRRLGVQPTAAREWIRRTMA